MIMNPSTECEIKCLNPEKVESLKNTLPSQSAIEKQSSIFKVMGHPVRIAILCLLQEEKCCVCDLARVLNEPVSTVSQHLKALKTCGVLSSQKEGKLVFYEPIPRAFFVFNLPFISLNDRVLPSNL